MIAITAPAGNSAGARTIRPMVSQIASNTPPRSSEQGMRIRLSGLIRDRTRWGTISPTNPIGPVKRDHTCGQHGAAAISRDRQTPQIDTARACPGFAYGEQIPIPPCEMTMIEAMETTTANTNSAR